MEGSKWINVFGKIRFILYPKSTLCIMISSCRCTYHRGYSWFFSLSISDFHPDTWNPAWSVGTILTGLCSFMVEESKTFGSIECDQLVRKRFARQSGVENLKNDKFKELFPGSCNHNSPGIIIARHHVTHIFRFDKGDQRRNSRAQDKIGVTFGKERGSKGIFYILAQTF